MLNIIINGLNYCLKTEKPINFLNENIKILNDLADIFKKIYHEDLNHENFENLLIKLLSSEIF